MKCNLCARNCNVDRTSALGFCQKDNKIEISKVMLHYGEEPFLTNGGPSGAIFFAGCNLKCVYCQNYEISNGTGKPVSAKTLVDIFIQLEKAGAQNIDLVSPTHYAKQIIEALKIYKPSVPVIYNCGGYENPELIKELTNFVDIFLIDLKYYSDELAVKYSSAPNYFSVATACIKTIEKLKPNKWKNGQLIQGLVIRHLCLPSHNQDSKAVLSWIASNNKDCLVSIMSQYVPMHKADEYEEINRSLKPLEYKIIVNFAKQLGLKNALVQELSSNTTELLPNFSEKDSQFKY